MPHALGVVALILTWLAYSSDSHGTVEDDPVILQVTDNRTPAAFPSSSSSFSNLLRTATELRFKFFVQEHEKSYSAHEEYVHRLGVFAQNLIRAAEHQAMDPTAIHGVTQFSDLTQDEFEMMYTGVKGGSDDGTHLGIKDHVFVGSITPATDVSELPANFD